MIRLSSKGSFSNTDKFLQRIKSRSYFNQVSTYGAAGIAALQKATPMESGQTANSWYYQITDRPGYFAVHWFNSHSEEPGTIPIAAIIQYGHGTKNGGYIQGRDYINPAMRPIFDQMLDAMWKEVTK